MELMHGKELKANIVAIIVTMTSGWMDLLFIIMDVIMNPVKDTNLWLKAT